MTQGYIESLAVYSTNKKNGDTIDSSKGDNEQGISVDEMLNKVDAFLREKDEVIETKDTTTKAQEKTLRRSNY